MKKLYRVKIQSRDPTGDVLATAVVVASGINHAHQTACDYLAAGRHSPWADGSCDIQEIGMAVGGVVSCVISRPKVPMVPFGPLTIIGEKVDDE